jgi:hypothetical protein
MGKRFIIFILLFVLPLCVWLIRTAQVDSNLGNSPKQPPVAAPAQAKTAPTDARAFGKRLRWIVALNQQMPVRGVDASAKFIEGSQGERLCISGPAVNRVFAYQFIQDFARDLSNLGFTEVTFYGSDRVFRYDVKTNMLAQE